jgi:hypothetical protein
LPVASPDGRDCHPCGEIEGQGCVKRLIRFGGSGRQRTGCSGSPSHDGIAGDEASRVERFY